jgi:parallel beta-helix repeat protein
VITNNYISIGLWSTALNNTICKNLISNCTAGGVGLYLDYSTENTISDNIIINGHSGIRLYWSGSNTLTNNSIIENLYNFGVYGESLSDFIQNIDTWNTINGKPIYYLVNQHSQTVLSEAGYVAIINSTNMTVKNLNLENNVHGVLFVYVTNSTIMNVNASNNDDGILLWNSNGNIINGNTVTDNDWSGISLYHSGDNMITGNIGIENKFVGIEIDEAHNNVIDGNTLIKNLLGIMVYYSDNNIICNNTVTGSTQEGLVGISLTESQSNVLSGNTISDNRFWIGSGIYIEWYSNNNTIIQNILENNHCAINIGDITTGHCNNNTVYHNNFISNGRHVISLDSINSWDNDYPSGGNYWGDHPGNDTYTGPYQNMTGSDGLKDTPYDIDERNKDRYPLIRIWTLPIPGDLNKDCVVDMRDIALVAGGFGAHPGHPRWNLISDLNQDQIIDLRDIALVARHFGETC